VCWTASMYCGATEGPGRSQQLRERIEEAGWAAEVEIVRGGQRSDHLLVAVE
jgi:phage head maturation protease